MSPISAPTSALATAQASAKTANQDSALRQLQGASEPKSLKQAAEQFEAIFLQLMINSMRATVPKSGFMQESSGENIFRGMLDQEYAKAMAEQRMTGIAQGIERQFSDKVASEQRATVQKIGLKAYHSQSE